MLCKLCRGRIEAGAGLWVYVGELSGLVHWACLSEWLRKAQEAQRATERAS